MRLDPNLIFLDQNCNISSVESIPANYRECTAQDYIEGTLVNGACFKPFTMFEVRALCRGGVLLRAAVPNRQCAAGAVDQGTSSLPSSALALLL